MNRPERVRRAVRTALAATAGRAFVGFSGGLDSTVLLHVAARARPSAVHALHVDHGLHPDAAGWRRHCELVSNRLGVPFSAVRVDLAPGANLEARARAARYAVFAGALATGDVLLTAHHRDDQAETLLYRLMRGAGLFGLGGMPAERRLGQGRVLRPLLGLGRDDLMAAAESLGIDTWIEDPMNADVHYDRGFLRHEVLPRLGQRWPAAWETLSRTAADLAADGAWYRDLLTAVLEGAVDADGGLRVAALASLPAERRERLVRFWLEQHAIAPARGAVGAIAGQSQAGADRGPRIDLGGGRSARRYRGIWRVTIEAAAASFDWRLERPRAFAAGTLSAQRTAAVGLDLGIDVVRVRFRRGGERLPAAGRGVTKTLKALFQEAGVPPWQRDTYPLLYRGDRLVAVPGLAVHRDHAAAPGWQLYFAPIESVS